ncbi:uncharacterized membrane protein YhaH (DUF805 family) [Staphylococcus hominis]
MIEAFKLFWQNYFNIKSRTRRRHYWFAILANCIILAITSLLFNMITFGLDAGYTFFDSVYEVIDIIIFIGTFTMTVRRVHDTGHTMVLPLIILIFTLIREISSIIDRTYEISINGFFNGMVTLIIGIIVAIISLVLLIILVITFVFTIKDSEERTNKYGQNPKVTTA